MSLDKIKEKIISSAKEKGEEIIKEAEAQIQKELEDYKNTLQKEYLAKLEEGKKKIDESIEKLRTTNTLKLERNTLFKKKELLDKFFASLKENILKDEKAYLEFLSNLIKKDAEENSTVYLNSADLKKFGKEIESFIHKNLKGKNVTLSKEPVNIDGGCIIKTQNYEIDDSIDEIISSFRESHEIEIAKEIFGNE